jgi:hypothetical protein
MATNPPLASSGRYERSDASPRSLVYFTLAMAAVLAVTCISLIWLFKHYEKTENSGSFVAAPFAGVRPLPPPPRIQPNPAADMQSYLQSQQDLLNSYGWIDRQNGIVRLPIDRAMELLLERGLPTRAANTQQTETAAPKTRNGSPNSEESRGKAR